MKKTLLSLLAVGAVLSFQPAVAAETGEQIFKSKPCVGCHSVDSKLVGPALKDVAARFADDPGAVDMLADKIKNGTQGGIWGPMPMPPNQVTEEQAKILAEWVMSLNKK